METDKHIVLKPETLILFNEFKAQMVRMFSHKKDITDNQIMALSLKKALNKKLEL